jgi:hypothetical protein
MRIRNDEQASTMRIRNDEQASTMLVSSKNCTVLNERWRQSEKVSSTMQGAQKQQQQQQQRERCDDANAHGCTKSGWCLAPYLWCASRRRHRCDRRSAWFTPRRHVVHQSAKAVNIVVSDSACLAQRDEVVEKRTVHPSSPVLNGWQFRNATNLPIVRDAGAGIKRFMWDMCL